MKLILIIIFTSMIFSEKVKEPTYKVIKKEGDIEIREYGTYVVAKTSISKELTDLKFIEMEIVGIDSPLINKFISKKTSQFYKILS